MKGFAEGGTLWDRACRSAQAWHGHAARRPRSPAAVAIEWRDVLRRRTVKNLVADGVGGRFRCRLGKVDASARCLSCGLLRPGVALIGAGLREVAEAGSR